MKYFFLQVFEKCNYFMMRGDRSSIFCYSEKNRLLNIV